MYRTLISLIFVASPVIANAADINASKVPGYDFSYLDIQQNCTLKREGPDTLSVVCKGKHLKPVSRSCEGYIARGLESVSLNCSGGLWALKQRCKVEMRGANKGEFNCQI